MKIKDSDQIIDQFLRQTRLFWQVVFLVSVVIYGFSFIWYLNNRPEMHYLSYFRTIDLISFGLALLLALTIFRQKRRYFSGRALRRILEKLYDRKSGLTEPELTRQATRYLAPRLKTIWLLGATLVILGVLFFWGTFTSKNMHVYFIVGLYSLMMNYPRKDLFQDIPYLAHEVCKEKTAAD